jgi:hypothetical protein
MAGIKIRKLTSSVVVVIIFLIVIFSNIPVLGAEGESTVISMSPSTQQVGEEGLPLPKGFNITVNVANVEGLFAWQIWILYSPRALRAISATYPPGHIFDGKNFHPVQPLLNQNYTKKIQNSTIINFNNPIGSLWLRIIETGPAAPPRGTQQYNITNWTDRDNSGTLSIGDIVYLEPKVYPTFFDYYYVDRIEWEGPNVLLTISQSYMQFGATLLNPNDVFSGSGTLCQITFEARRPGAYPLNFSGNDTFWVNSSITNVFFDTLENANVQVYGVVGEQDKDSSSLTLELPASAKRGDKVTIKGTLSPFKQGTNIKIYHKPPGGTAFTQIASVQTDEYSKYSYSWTADTTGEHEFYAVWDGDEETKMAQSLIRKIMITETGQTAAAGLDYLYIVIGVVALIIIILAVYVVRKRRRQPVK